MILLEEENYVSIFKLLNKKYSKNEALEVLKRDHPNGENIIAIYNKGNLLIGWLRFIIDDAKLRVLGLHIRKGNEYCLKEILIKTSFVFSSLNFEKVYTDVHKVNNKSLLLHIRLGFQYYKMFKHKVTFTLSKQSFLNRLERYKNYCQH